LVVPTWFEAPDAVSSPLALRRTTPHLFNILGRRQHLFWTRNCRWFGVGVHCAGGRHLI